jgi:hypothetical protein
MFSPSLLAARRVHTLHWLTTHKDDLLALIRENYAGYSKCPLEETLDIKKEILEGGFEDLALLDFTYISLSKDIEEFARENHEGGTQPYPYNG